MTKGAAVAALRAFAFLAGLAAVVTGVALLSTPAAFIVGGSAICGIVFALERTEGDKS